MAMNVTYVFAALIVRDRDAAAAWYERLLGRPPSFLPNDEEAVWQLAETGAVYILADTSRAGQSLVGLVVDDLDQTLAMLAKHGITPREIEHVPGGRKAVIIDPDGNEIGLIHVPQ